MSAAADAQPVRYECAVDVEAVSAVDMHVHLEVDDHGHAAMPDDIMEASTKYFKSAERTPSIDRIAEIYREQGIAAVVFTVDATTQMGREPNSIDQLVAGCARNNDILIPFGSVDPRKGEAAITEARRQAGELGVRGFKFHPSVQGFDPSDGQFAPLWDALEEIGLPCIFHTGQNGMGAGLPGGRGIKLKYSNPLLLDDVAAEVGAGFVRLHQRYLVRAGAVARVEGSEAVLTDGTRLPISRSCQASALLALTRAALEGE